MIFDHFPESDKFFEQFLIVLANIGRIAFSIISPNRKTFPTNSNTTSFQSNSELIFDQNQATPCSQHDST